MLSKKKYIFFLVLLPAIILAGCSSKSDDIGTNLEVENAVVEGVKEAYYSFTDALDKNVVLQEKPSRVVSLVGSFAETWILAGGDLVGVTDDVISEGRMEETDGIQIVGTIKEPNVEEILSLAPDFVLLSPDVDNHFSISETLEKAHISHGFFKIEEFDDYLSMLNTCTDITGNKELYEKNGLTVKNQIEDIMSKVADKGNDKPSILFVRAFSSGAKAKKDDNMTCTILDDLATVNIAAKHESLLEDLSIEEIIEEDPDYIFVTTMGNTEKAIEALKNGVEQNPAWSNLSAVKNNRYIVLPKELFHYKPNAKWGESYRYLAEIIYPEIFE